MMAHRHTALVVEDEPAIRELIVDVLAQEGFAAHQAEDGAEALRLLEQRPHDYCVMLLDCMLPTVAGVEVLRYLRRHDAGVPVIAMSASQGHLAEAIQAGATLAMRKPFDLDHLIAVVTGQCAQQEEIPLAC
jgi:DNA-binding response OmpR family regulator